jgi:ankyrin repeat protein
VTAAFRDRRDILTQLLDAGIAIDARDEAGQTALMGAARAGRTELVRALLARGADPALQDVWGYTALTWTASSNDNPETVELLLAAGAPVDAPDDKGRAALLHAASSGHLGAVRALLKGGADPRRRHPELGTARECARRGDCPRTEEIAALLEDAEQRLGDAPIPEPRPGHRPPSTEKQEFKKLSHQFRDAALENQEEALRMLAATPSLLDSHALVYGETPLHWAAIEGRSDAVRFLAGLGANVDSRDDGGDTPLVSAVYLEQIEVLELLLSLGANPNVVSKVHDSALECAVRSGNVRSVELLLDAGANPAGLDLKESLPEDESSDPMMEFLRGRGLLRDAR